MKSGHWHVVAAATYLAVAVWVMRAVLPVTADGYPLWASLPLSPVGDQDQSHFVWAASRNARTLLTAPWRLRDFEICYPFPDAVALGHHMYASGFLGLIPYALTGEPIFTSNIVALLMLWLSAVGMYALAFHWTRSVPAAFVAGALFGFQFRRVTGARWPSVIGNEWTPLVLLFLDRTFTRRRWRDAVGLATFVMMQLLESFYQLVPAAVYGCVFGTWEVVRHRTHLRDVAPKLAMVAAVATVVLAFVMAPYLHVRDAWAMLGGRDNLLPPLNAMGPGTLRYPGTGLLLLAAIGLADRVRRHRTDDPRVPLAIAGLAVLALITSGVTIPGLGFLPSPGLLAIAIVPGLDAVRGLQFALVGLWIAASGLAAYGVLTVVERCPGPARLAVGCAIGAVVLSETLVPAFATRSFGSSATLIAAPLPVPRAFVRSWDEVLPDGPVLDVPAGNPPLAFQGRAHRVVLAAFHRRATPSCVASFLSPLSPDVEAIGTRLPDPAAAEALYALGFRSVILHEEEYRTPEIAATVVQHFARLSSGNPRLVDLGAVEQHRLYRLESTTPVRTDLAPLMSGAAPPAALPVQRAGGEPASIEFQFRNGRAEAYRHPDPIERTALVARWSHAGRHIADTVVTALLPLALAPGDGVVRRIELTPPPGSGLFIVELAPAAAPSSIVARARVDVMPGLHK